MDWTTVTRRTKQRRSQREQNVVPEGKRTSKHSSRVFQIFVKVDNSQAFMTDVIPSDKVSDVMRKIPNSVCCSKRDVYVMFEGRVSKRSAEVEVEACDMREESTLHINHRARGGRTHKNKKLNKHSKVTMPQREQERKVTSEEEDQVPANIQVKL